MVSVWKAEEFLRSSDPSFPYENDYAHVYRMADKRIFFKREAGTKRIKEKDVLKKGYLIGKNGFYDPEEDPKDTGAVSYDSKEVKKDKGSAGHGVYAGFIETVKKFNGNVILKLQVPTSDLITLVAPPDQREHGGYRDSVRRNNLKQLKEDFGSAKRFQNFCQKTVMEELHYESVQFVIPHEVPIGARDGENQVKAAWDMEFSDEPLFEPLSSYVKTLKNRHPEKVSAGEKSKLKERLEEELENLRSLIEYLKKLEKRMADIDKTFEFIEELPEKNSAKGEYKKIETFIFGNESIDGWNELIVELEKVLSDILDLDIGLENPGMGLKELKESSKEIQSELNSLRHEVESIYQEERRRAVENQIDVEEIKEELEYDKKLEKKVLKELETLPNLAPAFRDIQKVES